MTGKVDALMQRILGAMKAGARTSKEIGSALGLSQYDIAPIMCRMADRKLVERGPREGAGRGGGCIIWRVARAAE